MKKLLLIALMACSGGSGTSETGTGGGTSGSGGGTSGTGGGTSGTGGGSSGTGGGTSGTGGGTSSATLTVSECEQDMDRFAAAHCADESQWTSAKTLICAKIPNTTSAPCTSALTKAKTCHTQFQQAMIFCSLGATDSSDPCAVDVLLGVFCVASVNSNLCMATQCMYDTDCPSGYGCNDKTLRCFKKDAPCLGLPCKYATDCPGGFTCNDAIAQCVRN